MDVFFAVTEFSYQFESCNKWGVFIIAWQFILQRVSVLPKLNEILKQNIRGN